MTKKTVKEIIDYITDNLASTDYHIAKIVKFIYENEYCVTTDGNKDKWFKYNGTNWETSTAIKHELKNRLAEDIPPLLQIIRTKLRDEYMTLHNNEKAFIESPMKTTSKMEQLMYNTHAKDKILHECESLFFVKELPKLN